MGLNSHDKIYATEDQVSSQLPNVTKDTQQAPDESLEWPEEVFKSLNFPTPGLQEMTAPAKLANDDTVKVKVKNPMTGKIEEKTCKVYSSHQHPNGSWTYKLNDGPGTPFLQNWTSSEHFEEERLKKVVPDKHAG